LDQIFAFFAAYHIFFTMSANLVILSVNEQDIASREEALIDRDSDIFDTKITVSPVYVSRSNLLDNVGTRIPFLEAAQASITPYIVEVVFPFPEFVSWCAERYSQEERVILNKLGSEVLCEIDSLSLQHTLSIPESSPTVSEPFEEEKMITIYRECPSEVKTHVSANHCQTCSSVGRPRLEDLDESFSTNSFCI
jgi:hypothetical protein